MSIIKKYSKDRKNCKVTFSLPKEAAPNASEIRVLGDFNEWKWENGLQLKAGKNEFKAQAELPAGKKYEFRYQIDQHRWENDWAADAYTQSPFPGIHNSVLILENGTRKSTTKTTTSKKATASAVKTRSTADKKAAPKRAANNTKNFTVIEGIGPKLNSFLQEAGYKTFEDLANAKPAKIKEVLSTAGKRYNMIDPTTWPQQAKLAATEKWEELKTLQDKLKGGK